MLEVPASSRSAFPALQQLQGNFSRLVAGGCQQVSAEFAVRV